jgi:outer membrane protein insertion porin family
MNPTAGINAPGVVAPGIESYQPRQRIAPIDVYVQEARTGRVIVGGSVNSDLGVAGQIIVDERNFNIRRLPRSWDDIWSGRAFRGGGQNFRMELMPGSQVERYTVSWTERNLFGYLPYSLSVGGFYYTRQFRDWTEQRLGGRVALGYEVTKDLAISGELRMEDVKIFNPRISGVSDLDDALGSNDVYMGRFRVAHDTRDSPFLATRGSLLELTFDQVFGEYDFSRGDINYSKYFLLRERPDGTGRHTIATTLRFGVTGSQTPIFENYFAGGYSTLRGFRFRGASPQEGGVQVGGEMLLLGSVEYMLPLTADEMLRGVAFVDYGTVERDLELNGENFRVSPGLGIRVTVPALGPAPLAFDFAYPVNQADTDETQVFSFFMGFTR